MFAYNDGAVHGSVEVYGDLTHWEPLVLLQIGESTQYAASSRSILALERSARGQSQYKFKVDGEWALLPGLPTGTDGNGNVNHIYDADELVVAKRVNEDLHTPYLHRAPPSPSGLLVYVIPGNPGMSEYYEAYVVALARLLPHADIVVPSHRGFDLNDKQGPHTHTLDEQVHHKIDFLTWFRKDVAPHTTRVALVGHSVGGWISQRVAVRAPDIEFVGLLMPTVRDIALSERGQKFTSLTKYVGAATASWYVWSLGWIPFSNWAVRQFLGRAMPPAVVPESARDASLRMMQNPGVVKQIVTLAIEEMQRIGPEEEPEEIRGFWDGTPHIWSLFARHDHWVSDLTRQELVELAAKKPNVSTLVVDGLRHAFCIRESTEVAGLTARAIVERIEA